MYSYEGKLNNNFLHQNITKNIHGSSNQYKTHLCEEKYKGISVNSHSIHPTCMVHLIARAQTSLVTSSSKDSYHCCENRSYITTLQGWSFLISLCSCKLSQKEYIWRYVFNYEAFWNGRDRKEERLQVL